MSNDTGYYLVRGATLECRQGSAPRKLNLPEDHGVYVLAQPVVNISDNKPNVNIMSFGKCTKTGNKCEPNIPFPWFNMLMSTKVDNEPAVTMASFLICFNGGLIEPKTSGQELDQPAANKQTEETNSNDPQTSWEAESFRRGLKMFFGGAGAATVNFLKQAGPAIEDFITQAGPATKNFIEQAGPAIKDSVSASNREDFKKGAKMFKDELVYLNQKFSEMAAEVIFTGGGGVVAGGLKIVGEEAIFLKGAEELAAGEKTIQTAKELTAEKEMLQGAKELTAEEIVLQNTENIELINGKVGGKIPVDEYNAIRNSSIKNPNADSITLGKYTNDSGSYIAKAGTGSSYFDMGLEFDAIRQKYGLSASEMFDYFNKPVLDDVILSNKTIRFSHDPRVYEKGFLVDEWEYIKSALHITDSDLIYEGGFWYVRFK